ncbi:MAG: FliA/WhiG family RNA polymerase sigma factor [Acutalibacter sp.]|jgi:RNA polymerase sigma factor for flagellar operon FliA|nr:FliA/WhiG family RNA polymerase sigma factor [Acutalibacter sp.]
MTSAHSGNNYDSMTTEELFALYQEAPSGELKWEIAMRYTGLIKSIALQIRGVFCSFTQLDDIINEGLIVLADAVDKFDPSRGRFEMFVSKRIRGMIVDLARQQDWVPRAIRRRAQSIERAMTELYNETGRLPTESQVAQRLGITMDEYQEAMANASLHSILSFEELFENSDQWPAEPKADGSAEGSPEQALMNQELTLTLTEAISQMKENEQLVLSLYYEQNLKMKDIAAVMDITPPRVSQIHARAVQKLKTIMEKYLRDSS